MMLLEACANCGRVEELYEVDLWPTGAETLCEACVPRDPECSCGGTGGDHDVDCVRWPF